MAGVIKIPMEGFQDIEIYYGIVPANSSRGTLKIHVYNLE